MGLERFVVDSNVFIAAYYEGDSNHKIALEVLGRLRKHTLIVHPYVIQEASTVLTYKAGRELAIEFLIDVEHSPDVVVPFVSIKEDIKNFIATQKKISFTDTALIGLAKQMDAQLVTFDRQMLAGLRK